MVDCGSLRTMVVEVQSRLEGRNWTSLTVIKVLDKNAVGIRKDCMHKTSMEKIMHVVVNWDSKFWSIDLCFACINGN